MFAEINVFSGPWTFGHLLVAIIVLAACIAIVCIALRQFPASIPAWVVQIFWVVVVAFVAIFAIRLLLGM